MKNIFIGLMLIFLDFNLTIGNLKIGLIPDFLGYIVMISGLAAMADESPLFKKIKPYAVGLAVYSGILYVMDFTGISASLGPLSNIFAIVYLVFSMYLSYNIVMGVIDMERKYNTFLNGNSLKSTWIFLAVVTVLTFASLLIPAVAIFFIIISFIVAICFLVAFNKSKNLYYEMVETSNNREL